MGILSRVKSLVFIYLFLRRGTVVIFMGLCYVCCNSDCVNGNKFFNRRIICSKIIVVGMDKFFSFLVMYCYLEDYL